MIVIFAGCDCTGKSTYASMMDKYVWALKKGSANDDLKNTIETLEEDLLFGRNIIHDRIPIIDDFVYSQIFSQKPSILMPRVSEISELLNRCVVIYFDCNDGEIIRRLRKRGDDYITEDQIPLIKSEYEKTFELLNVTPHRINTTYADPEKIIEEITEVIENENCRNRPGELS